MNFHAKQIMQHLQNLTICSNSGTVNDKNLRS